MGVVAQAVGAGAQLEFEGKVYRLAPLTADRQAEFELWLERRAVEGVQRQRAYLADAEYRDKMARVDCDIAAGVYSFGGPASAQAARSLPGLKELFRLALVGGQPNLNDATGLVDRVFAAKVEEATGALNRANADPKAKPPADTGAETTTETRAAA